MSTTTPTPPAPAPEPAPASSEGSGGWLEGVKEAAVKQYDGFKKANPAAAAKIETVVHDVSKQVEDFSLSQTEKAAMQKMDEVMAKLEDDWQKAKKDAWTDWQSCRSKSAAEGAKIRASIQSAQESVALAKKAAIANMQQAVNNSMTEIEAKSEADYAAAKSSAQAHYKKIQATDEKKAEKVKAGIADAETKLADKKAACIAQYEKALTEATNDLAAAKKEAADEYAKDKEKGTAAVDAAKATATKTADAGKARVAAVTAAAQTKESTIKSDLEADYQTAEVDAMEECDKLEMFNAAKAEEIEKKIRDAEAKIAAAKKAAMADYQKTLKQVTSDLQKLSSS